MQVELEIDAESLVKMITTAGANLHHELVAIVFDVVEMIKKMDFVSVTHVPRERNDLAHQLAKMGKEMQVGCKNHFQIPECVKALYMRDLSGVSNAASGSN